MTRLRRFGVFCAASLLVSGLSASVGAAAAEPWASVHGCPDAEVLFARGTHELPGVGPTGQAFVDAVQARLSDTSLSVYPVNYPASDAWATGIEGVRDAAARVVSMAEDCPDTKMVLGGFSQGAAVMGFVTSDGVPDGIDPATVPKPLQADVADHVVAVVLFGTPNVRAMNFLNQPLLAIGPLYQAKTIELCVPEDPVCSDGLNFAAHDSYVNEGNLVSQGADFAAARLRGDAQRPPAVPAQLNDRPAEPVSAP